MSSEESSTEIARDNGQAGGVGDLRSYLRIKLEIADIATSAMHLAREQKDDEGVLLAQKLLARIAEDRFNLVVVGLFNRGKSSLMNAVLGVDRLPVGVLPLTSVVTTVSYGSRERLILQREGWSIPQEEPISAITEYVTESGNPGNQKKVTLAEVQIPAEILRRGFHFIDTPGIGSALLQNTATTEEFLPEADDIIFVTSFEFPFTDAERQFFRKVRRHVRKIFLVANKTDLVSARERDEVLNFLRACVQKEIDSADLRVFAVSARDGLAAKTANQPDLITSSGLSELERSLIEFMTTEKSREFLVRLVDRAERLLQRQREELRLRRRAHDDPGFAEERLHELSRAIDELLIALSNIYDVVHQRIITELPKKLRPEFDAELSEAGVSASKKMTDLLSGEKLFHGSLDYKHLEKTVNSECALKLSEEMHEVQKRLERTVRELGGTDLQQLCESPAKVREIGNELLGVSRDIPEDGQEGNVSPGWPAGFHELQPAWTAPWFLWFYRIPLPTLRRYILQKCLQSLAQALLINENAALESTSKEACTWLENLTRDTKIMINTRAQRLRDILQGLTKLSDLGPLDSLMARMAKIRNALHEWSPMPDLEQTPDQVSPAPVHKEPCIICSKSLKALYDFFSKNQYDLIADQQVRLEHARVAGFCPLHTWHYAKMASAPGICFAYAPLLSTFSKQLEEIRASQHSAQSSKNAVLQLLPGRNSCPACNVVKVVEEATADGLVVNLSAEGTEALGRSLCLPHLALLLGESPGEAIEPLLHEQAELLERTAEDMRGYSLKHNAIRRALLTEEEQSAATRGLIHAAGYAGLSAPWNEDDS
jgi:GTP-binding protein EngB required for normal cell division